MLHNVWLYVSIYKYTCTCCMITCISIYTYCMIIYKHILLVTRLGNCFFLSLNDITKTRIFNIMFLWINNYIIMNVHISQIIKYNSAVQYTCTCPSSPRNAILSLFLCSCLISDFRTCSYASSNKWSLRILNFNLELWAKPRRANCNLKLWSLAEKACFCLCIVETPSSLRDSTGSLIAKRKNKTINI